MSNITLSTSSLDRKKFLIPKQVVLCMKPRYFEMLTKIMNPCHLKCEILVVVIPYSTQKQLFLLNAFGRC